MHDEDDCQECVSCGDLTYCLSSRGWCDGCEEEADIGTPLRRIETAQLVDGIL